MSKTTTKLLVAVIGLFVALALTATTTFAWFTMSQQPKVAQFELSATTLDTDLLVSMKYSNDIDPSEAVVKEGWSPFLPNVSQEYFQAVTVGETEDNSKNIFAAGNIADGLTLNHATAIDEGAANVDENGNLVLTGGYGAEAVPLTANTANSFLKLTFKFQSTTQYIVRLNTTALLDAIATDSDLAKAGNYVKAKGEAPTQAIKAWNESITVANYGKAVTQGEVLSTRAANAARVGFVGKNYVNCGSDANYDVRTTYYTYDSENGVFVEATNASTDFEVNKVNLYKLVANTPVIWNPNIENGFCGSETNNDGVGNNNLAYQYAQQKSTVAGDEAMYSFGANKTYLDGNIYDSGTADSANLVTLQEGGTDGVYEGTLDVYVWLEGWDGDCFNNILGDKMDVRLTFKGTKVTPAP